MTFIKDDLTQLIDLEEFLGAEDFSSIETRLEEIGTDGKGQKRIDRLSTVCTRLLIHILREDYKAGHRDQENLCSFLKSDKMPKDLVVGLAMDISREDTEEVKEMLRSDPQVSEVLLESM